MGFRVWCLGFRVSGVGLTSAPLLRGPRLTPNPASPSRPPPIPMIHWIRTSSLSIKHSFLLSVPFGWFKGTPEHSNVLERVLHFAMGLDGLGNTCSVPQLAWRRHEINHKSCRRQASSVTVSDGDPVVAMRQQAHWACCRSSVADCLMSLLW